MTFDTFLNGNSDIVLAVMGAVVVLFLATRIIHIFKYIISLLTRIYGRRF